MQDRLKRISFDEMGLFVNDFPSEEREILLQFGSLSNPLYVGTYEGQLVCLVGLIPPTLLSDTAYIWCHHTDLVADHKLLFGRYAKRLVAQLMQLYPRLIGHCLNEDSWRWLRSLGAKLTSPNMFEIV